MPAETIPIRRLPGAPKLSVDYVTDFSRLSELFAYDFRDPAALVRAARTATARDLPREELADVLLAQNRSFGSGEQALGKIELLRDRECAVVVTGQQPGLFGGPLYNLYKAATTVRLALRVEEETGRACLPVFWVAGDDHQLAGVDHIHTLDDSAGPVRITWSHEGSRRIRPLSALTLDEGIVDALARLAEAACAAPHRDEVVDLLSDCYRVEDRFCDGFSRLLAKLFEREGLVVIDASDPRVRRLGMGSLAAELEFPSPSTEAARAASEQVAALGYPVQVALRDDRLNLFSGRAERFRLRCAPSGFEISIRSGTIDAAELRSRFSAALEDFSPNVLLRPLYQDALFPTAAYVAGPSEIAYFAQLKPVYSRFGIPMPVVYPRKSITLINRKARELLTENGLRLEDFWADPPVSPDTRDGEWLSAYLRPGGEAQERVLGLVQGLLDSGLGLVSTVVAGLELDEFDHQAVLAHADDPVSAAMDAERG